MWALRWVVEEQSWNARKGFVMLRTVTLLTASRRSKYRNPGQEELVFFWREEAADREDGKVAHGHLKLATKMHKEAQYYSDVLPARVEIECRETKSGMLGFVKSVKEVPLVGYYREKIEELLAAYDDIKEIEDENDRLEAIEKATEEAWKNGTIGALRRRRWDESSHSRSRKPKGALGYDAEFNLEYYRSQQK